MKFRSTHPNVVVCGVDRAEDHLRHTKHGSGKKVEALISIASPASSPSSVQGRTRPTSPAAAVAARKLYLEFDDATAPLTRPASAMWGTAIEWGGLVNYTLPSMEDVQKVLRFGKDMPHFATHGVDLSTRVIIHCYAGHSRSTAAALMLFLQAMPTATDTEVLRAFTSACEEGSMVRPNYLMLKLADQALDAKGRLLDLDSQLNASLSRMY